VHRRAVPAQHRLPHAVDIDDDGGDRIAVLGAGSDRLGDRFVGEGRGEAMLRDQPLRRCTGRVAYAAEQRAESKDVS